MHTEKILATMTDGQLYCPRCSVYDAEDLELAHTTLVTELDRDLGTEQAEWLEGACCGGCGEDVYSYELPSLWEVE
jgi:hypothetical protein